MVYDLSSPQFIPNQTILASDGIKRGGFGRTIEAGLDGVFIGADGMDAVYWFQLEGGQFKEKQKLKDPSLDPVDSFGNTVETNNDWVFISATANEGNTTSSVYRGAVYIYKYDGVTWVSHSRLTPPIPEDVRSLFGQRICSVGDMLVVGDRWDNVLGVRAGAAYVFRLTDDVWELEAKLTAPELEGSVQLGRELACREDEAILHAYSAGKTLVYRRLGDEWHQMNHEVVLPGGFERNRFFSNMEMSGDLLFVANSEHPDPLSWVGTLHVLANENDQWHYFAKTQAPDPSEGDGFGQAVTLSDELLIVGAPYQDRQQSETESYLDEIGAVYLARQISILPPQPEPEPILPSSLQFALTYPNPASISTTIKYQLTDEAPVSITLYDTLGRLVRAEINGVRDDGSHEQTLNVSLLPNGVYFYRIQIGRFSATKPLTVIH